MIFLSKNDISQGVIDDIQLPEKIRFGIRCNEKEVRFSIDELSHVEIVEDAITQGNQFKRDYTRHLNHIAAIILKRNGFKKFFVHGYIFDNTKCILTSKYESNLFIKIATKK